RLLSPIYRVQSETWNHPGRQSAAANGTIQPYTSTGDEARGTRGEDSSKELIRGAQWSTQRRQDWTLPRAVAADHVSTPNLLLAKRCPRLHQRSRACCRKGRSQSLHATVGLISH